VLRSGEFRAEPTRPAPWLGCGMKAVSRRTFALLCVSCVLAACGSGAAPSSSHSSASSGSRTPTVVPVSCTQAQRSVKSGDYKRTLTVGAGSTQRYWTVVPPAYDATRAAPLYLLVAVGDGDPDTNYPAWKAWFAGVKGLLVVAGAQYNDEGTPALLSALLDRLENDYCIDRGQVHVIGASSSAWKAAQFACAASDRVASFAASLGDFQPASCPRAASNGSTFGPPVRPVPVVAYTGAEDLDATVRAAQSWAKTNGCSADPLVEDLGSGVTKKTYQHCRADVVLYELANLGHQFPMHTCTGPGAWICAPYKQIDSVELWTTFFATHQLS